MDAPPPEILDLTALARQRATVGPAPEWIKVCPFDMNFKPASVGAQTYLMIEEQVCVARSETYFHAVVRLETMAAVQSLSQWALQLDPQTQWLKLHSLTIRRNGVESERLLMDRLQFLRRESGLPGLTLDGWVTILCVLEDVAPGDILEYSYTIMERRRLLPSVRDLFFTLPFGTEIGKYHFRVLNSVEGAVPWKSNPPSLVPAVSAENGASELRWEGEKFFYKIPDPDTPLWNMDFPWIQVSQCKDWQTVAVAVCESWKEETGECFARLVEEIKAHSPELQGRMDRAMEIVQDTFRYLSVNIALGGQIPAPADAVARRRYGDCKDTACLLVMLLRALGLAARPVLVHAHWRRTVSKLLPSLAVFNHVVTEFEFNGSKYWVDATMKSQGGGALGRIVENFGSTLR